MSGELKTQAPAPKVEDDLVGRLCAKHADMLKYLEDRVGFKPMWGDEISQIATLFLDAATLIDKLRRKPTPQVEMEPDRRPDNCTFRLQDAGKPFPKSGCEACGKTIMTGLGRACSVEQPPVDREA